MLLLKNGVISRLHALKQRKIWREATRWDLLTQWLSCLIFHVTNTVGMTREWASKLGGASRSQHQMDGFHEAVNLCGFQDLGYFGPKFT